MRIYLSLGSNLGDREANLRAALQGIAGLEDTSIEALSHCYETEPVGTIEQPDFLNMAVEICTELSPTELLNATQEIERHIGRTRNHHWGPRIVDIDLLLYEDKIITTETLTLPHPEFRGRAFVLTPMAEIAPDVVDPITGDTMATLAASSDAQGDVVKRHRITP